MKRTPGQLAYGFAAYVDLQRTQREEDGGPPSSPFEPRWVRNYGRPASEAAGFDGDLKLTRANSGLPLTSLGLTCLGSGTLRPGEGYIPTGTLRQRYIATMIPRQ